jgi:hypothetical protein
MRTKDVVAQISAWDLENAQDSSLLPVWSKKLERAEDKERMMVRFDEEDPSGAPVSVRDRDGESAASAAEWIPAGGE